jgi:hypothetical protein
VKEDLLIACLFIFRPAFPCTRTIELRSCDPERPGPVRY